MAVQTEEKFEIKNNNLSITDLITKSLENDSSEKINVFKQELISKGRDNIHTRIEIKKSYKSNIANLEAMITECEEKKLTDKKLISALKIKLLNIVSLIDRLQLEWQKHDLRLK